MTNVGVYLRLSLSDQDLGKDNKDESNSIENQRLLIRSFLEKNEGFDGKVIEYVDDGYSGTNFDRPGFKKMIEDAKKGVIQVIIAKDLSRLGRNYIGVGDYLEQIFPSLGIRVIALNSNYDSNNYIGKTLDIETSISNLINSMYSKDISKKISSAYHTRWKAGINTSAFPPYGYVKNKDRTWEIDPEASAVIKTIFALACDKKDITYIVEYLNSRKVLTPAEYMNSHKKGITNNYHTKCKEPLWDKRKVYAVLKKTVYTGIMEHGRRKLLSVGGRKTKLVNENERYIIENDHPAIVSKEDFEKAQEVIRPLEKTVIKTPQNNPLTGKLICGNCGLRMLYTSGYYKKIYCPHGSSAGRCSKCSKEPLDAKVIEARVSYFLRQQIGIIRQLKKDVKAERKRTSSSFELQKQIVERSVESLNDERIRLYEDFANGHISKESYLKRKGELNEEKSKMQMQLDSMTETREKEDTFLFEAERVINKCADVSSRRKLTKEIADTFIESVIWHDKDHIEIEFKFEDIIKEYLDGERTTINLPRCVSA